MALAKLLHGEPIGRTVSSPYVRCRETLEPLAADLGLLVQDADGLIEITDGGWDESWIAVVTASMNPRAVFGAK